ncbi:MAG: glycosyl hydrolase, partial [Chloroflexota bacterium]|nr:glycosyl hydrolase [Chloroflexota bacterium]
WRNMGLAATRHIGKIRIHPKNPDIVYVAAFGHAWGTNPERGVYRSTDGGETWELVLHKSDRAGSHDIAMDPNNPRIIYASIWQAQRYPHQLISGGEDSGLWKTTDGGDTWTELTRKPGLPTGILGKIGIAASPARPDRAWAIVEAEDGGLFRTDDGGETWERVSDAPFLRTRAWYYCHLIADPQDAETVWGLDYGVWKSTDGGRNFTQYPSQHGDEHDLWISPHNTQIMIKGDDGGACVTYTGGASWSTLYNQPTAQLYHATTDDRFPYRVYGSQQDNSAISVPSMSVEGAIHERDWFEPGGGESGYIGVKHDDPDLVVASGPIGPRAFNDRMHLYNHRTGQRRNITVWPELYGWALGAGDLKYRFQWTFPIFFSRHDPNTLYVAGNRVFRSTDLGTTWEPISPDLTRNDPSRLQSSGGPITRDNTGAEVYCTIFALAESPHKAGLFWAGSDDGLVHISEDDGKTWTNITPPDLPEWALISIIEPSPHDPATAYVAATRYKSDDTTPYVYKTTDSGKTWTTITNGIPAGDFTRVVREDPEQRGLLYAGTETGIYVSFDDGGNWQRVGGSIPLVPIHDLVIKGTDMVVATHGRAFWILDDVTPFRQIAAGTTGDGTHLFAPRPTVRVRIHQGFGGNPVAGMVNHAHAATSVVSYTTVKRSDGTTRKEYVNAGANPPDGVIIQYFLAEPPADSVAVTIKDQSGTTIRTYMSGGEQDEAPSHAGLNRLVWDMRYTGVPTIAAPDLNVWERSVGPMVVPGTYTVELTTGDQTFTQPVAIVPDPRITATAQELVTQRDMLLAMRDRLAETQRAVSRIRTVRGQAETWEGRFKDDEDGGKAATVRAAAKELKDELASIERELIDVRSKSPMLFPIGLQEKFNALFDAVDSADYVPTRQSEEAFTDLSERLDEQLMRLKNALAEEGNLLNRAIAATGIPAVEAL